MELTKEKNEVKSLSLDERVAYIGDLMIKAGEELACEAGFSGAAWEGLKAYLVCKLFGIDDLGGYVLVNRKMLNSSNFSKFITYLESVFQSQEMIDEAKRLLNETGYPSYSDERLWTKIVHNTPLWEMIKKEEEGNED